jgi:hypothetical protein
VRRTSCSSWPTTSATGRPDRTGSSSCTRRTSIEWRPKAFGCVNESPDAGGPSGDLTANVGHPSHPLQKGFDEFVGFVRHHHATEGYWPNYVWRGNERVPLPENEGEAREIYAPDLYMNAALDFIERHRDRPFCLYLTPQLVHWPNHVPDAAPYDDEPWTDEQKRYAAMHTRLDAYVGAVRNKLTELGLDDRTVVLFTSDNGPTVERAVAGSGECTEQIGPSPDSAAADQMWDTNGGLRAEKHSLYDGGIRVPMVVGSRDRAIGCTGRNRTTVAALRHPAHPRRLRGHHRTIRCGRGVRPWVDHGRSRARDRSSTAVLGAASVRWHQRRRFAAGIHHLRRGRTRGCVEGHPVRTEHRPDRTR